LGGSPVGFRGLWPRKPGFPALQQGTPGRPFGPGFGVFLERFRPLLAGPGVPGVFWLSQGLAWPRFFPVLGSFGPVFGPFGPLSASGRKRANPYRLVTGSRAWFSRVFGLFAPFGPFWGPASPDPKSLPTGYRVLAPVFPGFRPFSALFGLFSGPPGPRPGFRLYSKVVFGGSGPFWPVFPAPFGGGENRPSRGLPRALRAPNVPLPALWGPKRAHSGPEAEIRRHPWAFLACFRSAKTSQKGPRMPPDFGLRPKRGPIWAPRAPNGAPEGPRTPFWAISGLLGPFRAPGGPVWAFLRPPGAK